VATVEGGHGDWLGRMADKGGRSGAFREFVGLDLGVPITLGAGLLFMCLIAILAITHVVPYVTVPERRSGDPPRTVSHPAGDDLTRHTVIDAYAWSVRRAGIDTTFDPEQNDPYRLRGTLELADRACPGARVAWSIRVHGAAVSSGELSGLHRRHHLDSDRRLPEKTPIVLSAHRDDNHPCAATVYWRHPEATTG
jgi:hypothetical protein